MGRERAELLRKQSELLLLMFDDLAISTDEQRRGYLLQDLLNRTFDLHGIPVVRSFTRNEGGEQIDGAFKLEGWHYIVECRWRKKLSDIRELDGLLGQINRDLLLAKIAKLNLEAEPYYGTVQYLKEQRS
ncbi:MAG: hypothetical protein HY731_02750 [Candidatus Tectomicrobia bacterium]|nr:hypothetical protein [Candidatus Tectomicrobia bacterium]